MTEFKVGDRVRVINNKLIECCVNIGEIGTVLKASHPNYLVYFPERNNRWWLGEERLELIPLEAWVKQNEDSKTYTGTGRVVSICEFFGSFSDIVLNGKRLPCFIVDSEVFLESEGWKDPKKEMPKAGKSIEFVYSKDAKIYTCYDKFVYDTFMVYNDINHRPMIDADRRRSPDVISWRYINRAEPGKNIDKTEADSAKNPDPVETFRRAVDEFAKAMSENK